ncbi:MAG: M81 family metallopeptidase [Rubrivivax sp.]|nr:M81 family metallopeptidase [Rubrivivax sp.]
MVTRDAFERIAGAMVGCLSQAMPVDAVYLDLHGAMVTEDFEDGEGELLRRVRAAVGQAVPIIVSLDYHANVTPEMVAMTDAMIGYRTYPHVDRIETGQFAAKALEAVLARGRPAGRALRKAPFLIPLNGQCTLVNPSRAVVALSRVVEATSSISPLAGFPPADLHDCGPSVVAHAWTQEAADRAADEMMAAVLDHEAQFAEAMVSPGVAVARAIEVSRTATRPVVIADTQDNPGCGGTADSTGLLKALVAADAQGAMLGLLCDPEAARAALAAGEGADVTLSLGGHSGPEGVTPLEATYRVTKTGDGRSSSPTAQ